MNPVRIALVGCGVISEHHVRGHAAHSHRGRITLCCDIDLKKAFERADQVEALTGERPAIVDDYAAVLANPEIDSIELCTPSHLHTEPVIAAARAGKHVSCQKPLALTLADCDAMISAATEAGTILFYAEMFRVWEPVMIANRVIAEGGIGQVVGLQATYAHWQGGEYAHTAWRYDPKIAGGGQLIDGGIHWVDILRTIGGPISSVSCFAHRVRPELGGEDTTAVIFRYADDRLGTLMATHACALGFPGPSVFVLGTEAVLSFGGPLGSLVKHSRRLPDGHEVLLNKGLDPFVSMAGHYLDVLAGAPNLCSAESGREMLQIVLAAYRSAEIGRAVNLDEIN
jgi:predicted dehydrogenase